MGKLMGKKTLLEPASQKKGVGTVAHYIKDGKLILKYRFVL